MSAASCTPPARATTRSPWTCVSSPGTPSSMPMAASGGCSGRWCAWRRPTRRSVMPGYTHLQRAQPVLLAHHLLAYFEMLQRDRDRFDDCLKRVDVMPLGSGALAGVPYDIDREFVAAELVFSRVSAGTAWTPSSDRDFVIEYEAAAQYLHDASLAPGRGDHPVVYRRVRLHRDRRRLCHRLQHHAPEEEPGRGRTGPRQDRPGLRRPDGDADHDEGPAAGLQPRHAGRQGRPVRHRGHPRCRRWRCSPA